MKFYRLRNPSPGIALTLLGAILHINWSKSWYWVTHVPGIGRREAYFLKICTITKATHNGVEIEPLKALCIIAGPLKIMAGYSKKEMPNYVNA